MVKMPVFFTSAVAISARELMTLVQMDFFSSHFSARESAMAPFVMVAAFIAAFMGGMASGGG